MSFHIYHCLFNMHCEFTAGGKGGGFILIFFQYFLFRIFYLNRLKHLINWLGRNHPVKFFFEILNK